jgi:hypothetical protein
MSNTGKQKRRLPTRTIQIQAPTPARKPSLTRTRMLLAQFHLDDVEEELTKLRKTLREHRVIFRELRKGGDLPPSFARELVAVLERRDRQLASRLAKTHDTVAQAQQLLAAAAATEPAPEKN